MLSVQACAIAAGILANPVRIYGPWIRILETWALWARENVSSTPSADNGEVTYRGAHFEVGQNG